MNTSRSESRKKNDLGRNTGHNIDLRNVHQIYGKVPPQARDLEEAVLGACMLERGTIEIVSEIITADCFYVDSHQRIFKAMQSLAVQSQPIDILTVIEQLRSTEELDLVGGPHAITKVTNSVVSSANVETYARIIKEKYVGRRIITISGEALELAYEDSTDAFDLLDKTAMAISNVAAENIKGHAIELATIAVERMQRLYTLSQREDHLTGVPAGISPIDLVTSGWQAPDLIIVAARPSVGKTAFALNLARNAAAHPSKPTPVLILSLEMSRGQLTDRIMSIESGIPLEKIVKATLGEMQMERLYKTAVQVFAKYKIIIDDQPAINIMDARAKIRRAKQVYGIGLAIVDYLQLMSGIPEDGRRQGNREQEISGISRGLKAIAKECEIPLIALSQLSRESEKQGREPRLSDLRESGAIEQDADVVGFLSRPAYQMDDEEIAKSIMIDPNFESLIDFRIAKHRNGTLENIHLYADLSIQKFFDKYQHEEYQRNKMMAGPLEIAHKTPTILYNPSDDPRDNDDPPF